MALPGRANAKARRNRAHLKHHFNSANLFNDPFAVSSISIALVSWAIAIAGSIASASTNEAFPRFTWWGIAYQFLIICLLIVIYCYDVVDYYKLFLTSAIAVAFVYNTNSATNLVYSNGSKKAAASAGVILLSMVNLIWIFYFGSDNASPTNRWIDSFSLGGIRPSSYEDSLIRAIRRRSGYNRNSLLNKASSRFNSDNINEQNTKSFYDGNGPQHYVSSTALAGFENTEPRSSELHEGQMSPRRTHKYDDTNENIGTFITDTSNGNTETTMGDTLGLYSDIGEDTFGYTVKALYSYEADDADGYEISFNAGEILKVSDIEGRWWKATRANGEVGIIPSNYVELIESTEEV